MDEKTRRAVKTYRPPSRSVSMPIGSRATEPSKTGTATKRAVCDAVKRYRALKLGASPAINPHAANDSMKEIVASTKASVGEAPVTAAFDAS